MCVCVWSEEKDSPSHLTKLDLVRITGIKCKGTKRLWRTIGSVQRSVRTTGLYRLAVFMEMTEYSLSCALSLCLVTDFTMKRISFRLFRGISIFYNSKIIRQLIILPLLPSYSTQYYLLIVQF